MKDDLYFYDLNFVIGLARVGKGFLMSSYRFNGLDLEYECLKTVAIHDFGACFGTAFS